MPVKESPKVGKVRKKSSSGHTTIGRKSGVQGATTEINHYGELGSEASTFGQGDLQGSDVAAAADDKARSEEGAPAGPASVDRATAAPEGSAGSET